MAAQRPTRSKTRRRLHSGRALRVALIAITISAGAGLVAIPLGDWNDQQTELNDAREKRAELQAEIEGIEREIDSTTGPAGVEERGRCFGPFVPPGAETYSIPGVSGCVKQP